VGCVTDLRPRNVGHKRASCPKLVPSSHTADANTAHPSYHACRWGTNALRIRIGLGGAPIVDKPGALLPVGSDNKGHPTLAPLSQSHGEGHQTAVHHVDGGVTFTNGDITVPFRPPSCPPSLID
jgi:hypothetical protein